MTFLVCLIGLFIGGSLVCATPKVEAVKGHEIDRLRNDILGNDVYSAASIPGNVTVNFQMTILYFQVDEARSTLVVHAWIAMIWTDYRLKWNPESYHDIKELHVSPKSIWIPDISLYNNADHVPMDPFHEMPLVVKEDGSVTYVPRSVLRPYCVLDIRLWPFDTQYCSLKFGSWGHHGLYLDLELGGETGVDLSQYVEGNDWLLQSASGSKNTVMYACCDEPYVDVSYALVFTRSASFYQNTVFVPAIVVVILVLISFWLHPATMERLVLNFMNILICILYLIYLGSILPSTGNNTPLIVLFFKDTLLMVTTSVILTVLFRRLINREKNLSPPPPFIHRFVSGWFGTIFCLRDHTQQSQKTESTEDVPQCDAEDIMVRQSGSSIRSYQWNWLLLLIDRFAFILYAVIFAAFLLAFL